MLEHMNAVVLLLSTCIQGSGSFGSLIKKSACWMRDVRFAGTLSICRPVMSIGLNICCGIGAFRGNATLACLFPVGYAAHVVRRCWQRWNNCRLIHKVQNLQVPVPVDRPILSQSRMLWIPGRLRPARQ